ncbi:MAG: hypothetical protein QW757_02605 [Candidatus Woesearchaeota archaeon]
MTFNYIFNKKSQFAMEYILIMAIVLGFLISGIFVFRSYVFETNDFVINSKINQISNLIITNAKKIYFYGPNSKTTINFEMPAGISNIYILSLSGANETYLIFLNNKKEKLMFESSIPLYFENCDNLPDELCLENDCRCLKNKIKEGFNEISLEVVSDCIYNFKDEQIKKNICVKIN